MGFIKTVFDYFSSEKNEQNIQYKENEQVKFEKSPAIFEETYEETAKEIDEIKEVEWSLCLDTKGKIYLMDANPWKQIIFAQTPEYLNKKVGLLPYYKKVISRK